MRTWRLSWGSSRFSPRDLTSAKKRAFLWFLLLELKRESVYCRRNAKANIQCPVEPGTYEVEHTVDLPKEIPKGQQINNVSRDVDIYLVLVNSQIQCGRRGLHHRRWRHAMPQTQSGLYEEAFPSLLVNAYAIALSTSLEFPLVDWGSPSELFRVLPEILCLFLLIRS